MAQSNVRVPPDSTGKLVDTFETALGQQRQAVVLADPSVDANVIEISSRKRLPVEQEVQIDLDSGAGEELVSGLAILGPASGGAVVLGTDANPLKVGSNPLTAGGHPTSTSHFVAAGTALGDRGVIKASAGQLYGVHVYNKAGYPVFIKIHNKATDPTPGTDVVVRTIGVQADTQRDVVFPFGLAFGTGIAFSIVKLLPDADATAVIAEDCVVDFDYK